MQIKFDKILGCLRELDEGTGGGGTSGDTIITGTVATYAELPLASGYTGKYYIVDAATGTWILGTKKNAGIYKSNGITWIYIDSVPETTSLSDGTTVITGTNIILEGAGGTVTTADVNNNKILISTDLSEYAQAKNITSEHITTLNNTSGVNTGDETSSSLISKLGNTYLTPDGDASNLTNYNVKNLRGGNTTRITLSNLTNQSLTANVLTKINLTTEAVDALNEWDTTLYRFTPAYNQLALLFISFELSSVGKNTFIFNKDGAIWWGFVNYGSAFTASVALSVKSSSYYEFYLISSVSNTILSSHNKVFIDTLRGD